MCRSAQSAPASSAKIVKTRARGQFRGAVMQIVPDPAWLAGPSGRAGEALRNPALLSSLRGGLRGLYENLLEEPLPERLALYVRELKRRQQDDEAHAIQWVASKS